MNEALKNLIDRRSIKKYKSDMVPMEIMAAIAADMVLMVVMVLPEVPIPAIPRCRQPGIISVPVITRKQSMCSKIKKNARRNGIIFAAKPISAWEIGLQR